MTKSTVVDKLIQAKTKPKQRKKQKDVTRNEELVLKAFLFLEQELGQRPTNILQVASRVGLNRKKVGEYIKALKL